MLRLTETFGRFLATQCSDRIDRSAAAANGDYRSAAQLGRFGPLRRMCVMKLSARNQLKGKIVAVTKGQTTSHVRIDIGGGVVVTTSITNEAVDDFALKIGADALAVIKASD